MAELTSALGRRGGLYRASRVQNFQLLRSRGEPSSFAASIADTFSRAPPLIAVRATANAEAALLRFSCEQCR
jgi:hypothetical protein